MIALLLTMTAVLGTLQTVTVAPGEQLGVATSGSGSPIVLVPGLSSCAHAYRKVVPLLAEAGFETVVVEPLAIGASTRPPDADYTLTAQADRLAAVLDSLRLEPAVVVAHGVAVSMALRLAYRHADQVAAVVALEGGPDERAASAGVRRGLKLARIVTRLGGKRLIRDRFRGDLEAASGDPSWVTRRVVREYFAAAARDMDGTLTAFQAMAESQEPEALRPRLGSIRCPVVLVMGGAPHRSSVDPEDVLCLRENLPHFSQRTIPGAGHFLGEESPEAVAAAIAEMARLVGAASLSTPKTVAALDDGRTGGEPCVP